MRHIIVIIALTKSENTKTRISWVSFFFKGTFPIFWNSNKTIFSELPRHKPSNAAIEHKPQVPTTQINHQHNHNSNTPPNTKKRNTVSVVRRKPRWKNKKSSKLESSLVCCPFLSFLGNQTGEKKEKEKEKEKEKKTWKGRKADDGR